RFLKWKVYRRGLGKPLRSHDLANRSINGDPCTLKQPVWHVLTIFEIHKLSQHFQHLWSRCYQIRIGSNRPHWLV
ncbi:MAG: hypothetical protein ACOVQU_07060, partial [Exiguobacterium acetylicum]